MLIIVSYKTLRDLQTCPECSGGNGGYCVCFNFYFKKSALAGIVHWLGHWPVH